MSNEERLDPLTIQTMKFAAMGDGFKIDSFVTAMQDTFPALFERTVYSLTSKESLLTRIYRLEGLGWLQCHGGVWSSTGVYEKGTRMSVVQAASTANLEDPVIPAAAKALKEIAMNEDKGVAVLLSLISKVLLDPMIAETLKGLEEMGMMSIKRDTEISTRLEEHELDTVRAFSEAASSILQHEKRLARIEALLSISPPVVPKSETH